MSANATAERRRENGERLHISIGAVCNNNCLFCMEEDRDARYENNSAMTRERVRWMLEKHRGAEEVCFTSGEPTTRPELGDFAAWAKELGYERIAVMTNGRRLSQLAYAGHLIKRGINRFYVSIHGHDAKLHEGLTRTPGSFEQTVAGIASIASLKRFGVQLNTSTVLTDRNLPHLGEIYGFLRARGVDQVVFNVMQANGRADTYFEQIFPTYTEIAERFRAFLSERARAGETTPQAFLVDIPLCVTEGIADLHRGYVEQYFHYDVAEHTRLDLDESTRAAESHGRKLMVVDRGDLDLARRDKREECGLCRHAPRCEGVWRNYLRRRGWDEFVPVAVEPAGARG